MRSSCFLPPMQTAFCRPSVALHHTQYEVGKGRGDKGIPDERKAYSDYRADISAAFAQGIVGKAVKLASSDEFNELKESALSLIKRLDDIDLYELGAAVKQIAEYKLKVQDYFDRLWCGTEMCCI